MTIADFSLKGKVGLAEHGADVAVAARKPEPLAEAVEAVQALGRQAIGIPTNVRRIEELKTLVDETLHQLGRVDYLVNNAGTNPVYGAVQDIDERAWDMIMNTNVKSAHFLSNFAREAILQHGEGGAIVNVSSVGGRLASDVIGGYSVSKAAVIMLTQVQAKTWGTDGIRVNCIAPGLIKTDFARALWDDEQTRRAAEATAALSRIGDPDEMAGAVVYLCSPASSFVTGQTLVLDGGRLL
jgi:NAD(P)-dependent dehydrogenase (short-subunit alcohol dehydrogenase family)